MKLGISTSGPFAILAAFDDQNQLIKRGQVMSNRAASGGIIKLYQDLELSPPGAIYVDIGPGSFTGVRVGVMMAKMWSHIWSCELFSVTAFDLFSSGLVAIPSKKGEVFLRVPGNPVVTTELEMALQNPEVKVVTPESYSEVFSEFPACAMKTDPIHLEPFYGASFNISQAKQAHIMGETFGGRQDV